ncbi:MAG: nucleoside deaminase [Anaerolineae bacterium]|jgi:tRNA(Arg) A34 adenosine deaminase TadA|nr:nucleoside deaminase [Anaerolineae bacterium]
MLYDELPTPWQVCADEAWEAFLHKTVPIGACLLDADSKLISKGRNHIYDDDPTDGVAPWVAKHKLAHAELNCLLGARDRVTFQGTTLYSTVEPCPLCLGAIYMAGVRNLHYAVPDPYAGSTDLIGKTWYLSVKKMQIDRSDNDVFNNIMAAMNFYYFFYERKRRGDYWEAGDDVMARWTIQYPQAFQTATKVWRESPYYQDAFMEMNSQDGLRYWETQFNL